MLLITGCDGQLGKSLSALLPEAIAVNKNDLDITDENTVLNFVTNNNIDIIINCAAYTNVDEAQDNIDLATSVNKIGAENISKTGATIIHISTDYVFDGIAHKPYTEDDQTNPESIYGISKLAGERAILSNANTAIIIRTSWLYDSSHKNFLTTIKRIADKNDNINVVCDQIGSPTYVHDLARVIVDILPKIQKGTNEIYHYSNEGVCSWYDFAHQIVQKSNLNCSVMPIESKDYPTKAPRPYYSVLNKAKIKKDFNIKIPHWIESLEKCLNQS